MWRDSVSRLIKSEMSAKGVKYQDLSTRLAALGVNQSADNLRNKINKGILGADLLIQILVGLEVTSLQIEKVNEILEDIKKRATK
ncbi:hypothetical protein J3L16_12540 [Alteromonas sp. 5E99-2]|uniref:DUF6471 domain-containing protein n=1 Tax=Alteromonas sp. 5E99-2 TaxID=2817683 RepID=UPI001A9A2907|nr:DUF6471 domain-containing protein [Alteromonas sp. 5E99-2]MBO1256512.1 hypothetical protein [Alteromonas sp. 5E99-2]